MAVAASKALRGFLRAPVGLLDLRGQHGRGRRNHLGHFFQAQGSFAHGLGPFRGLLPGFFGLLQSCRGLLGLGSRVFRFAAGLFHMFFQGRHHGRHVGVHPGLGSVVVIAVVSFGHPPGNDGQLAGILTQLQPHGTRDAPGNAQADEHGGQGQGHRHAAGALADFRRLPRHFAAARDVELHGLGVGFAQFVEYGPVLAVEQGVSRAATAVQHIFDQFGADGVLFFGQIGNAGHERLVAAVRSRRLHINKGGIEGIVLLDVRQGSGQTFFVLADFIHIGLREDRGQVGPHGIEVHVHRLDSNDRGQPDGVHFVDALVHGGNIAQRRRRKHQKHGDDAAKR